MVISVVIFRGGYKIMYNAWMILMETVPKELEADKVIETMKSVLMYWMFMNFIFGRLPRIIIH